MLRGDFHITSASFGAAPPGVDAHVQLERMPTRRGLGRLPGIFALLRLLRLYRLHERLDVRIQVPLDQLRNQEWDVIIAHDVQTVAIAQGLRSRRGVLVDLHEYAPAQAKPSLVWNLLIAPHHRWICRTRVTKAAAVTTVGQGIADEYRRVFGIESTVVINATPYQELEPKPLGTTLRLVHSGVAAPGRKLEILVEAVTASKADVSIDFFLVETFPGYVNRLRALAGGDPRVRFNAAVPYRELIATLNKFDLGIHVLAPTNFNHLWALPNKLFDFIQARLGVIVGPSPEMERIVVENGIGVVSDGFNSAAITRAIDSLTPDQVATWKSASHMAARSLAGEIHSQRWHDIVSELVR